MDKEYILCSAIHFKDGKKHKHQPKNINSGIVVCGRRHHNCYYTAWGLGYDKNKTSERDVQGFLTNKDRFVNREEGAKIALEAKQIKHETDWLVSEDIY